MQESQQDVKSEPRDEQQLNVTSTPQHADAPKSERQKPETKMKPIDEDILLKVRDRGGRALEFRVRET